MGKEKRFLIEVEKLAKSYDLDFFIVTQNASMTRNRGNEAIKIARENHKIWEKKNRIDSQHDWLNEVTT